MTEKQSIKSKLITLGFKPTNGKQNIYSRKLIYQKKEIDTVTVDFNVKTSGEINWGHPKEIGRKTSSDLSKPESIVQLYWYIHLVESGYMPKNIVIEAPVQLGHKDGFIDLVVYKNDGTPFMALDAKTPGKEENKYTTELKESKGQVASYYRLSSNLSYVGVVSARITDSIEPSSYIVSTSLWKKAGSPEEYVSSNPDVADLPNEFKIAPNITPYSKKQYLLKPVDLIDLNENTASQMFHGFLTILRKHGISDKTNAFNKVLNLFIAKIVDEFNTPDDAVLSFQNNVEENETPEALYTRIEKLYSQGLRDFIRIYIDTDKDIENIKKLLSTDEIANQDEIVNKIEHLLSKTNSNFQFKDVYDENTYNDNLNILKELVDLIAPYKLKYAKKQQFLGDFFENILSNGFKQEAGQFFTPIPLAHFMVSALPLVEKTKKIINDENSRQLIPRMIDFACGSGHFLTEYMDRMQKIINKIDPSHLSRKNQQEINQYKANPFEWSQKYVYGLDIDYRLVKTSKVSSFLNGDGDAIIRRANGLDSFNSKDYTNLLHLEKNEMKNQVFDVLIANPPYHVDEFKTELPNIEEDFQLGKLVTDNSSEIEALFVERASQLLKTNGLMAIVLPSAILDTENSIYVEARKILLQRFKIIAIMKNPNKATFAATKVETVTIFAQRRNDDEVSKTKALIKKALEKSPITDITVQYIENFISKYIKSVFGKDFTLEDYTDLLNGDYSSKNVVANNYKKAYKPKKEIVSFSEYVKINELESLLLFALTTNKVVIIQTPSNSMTESLQLLGYKFSDRRGQEGLHPRLKNYSIEDLTLLYGDKGNYLDYIVRHAFAGDFTFEDNIDDSLKPFYRIKDLTDLIDFSAKTKTFKLMLSKALIGTITDYGEDDTIALHQVATLKNGTTIKATQTQPGNIPVIAGGREPAYYNDSANRTEPTITISQSGAYAGFISYHEDPIFASDCFTIVAKPNSGYSTLDLYYLLKNKQKQIYSFATGSIQKHVYAKDMEDFKIPDINQNQQKAQKTINDFKEKAQYQRELESSLIKLQQELIDNIDTTYKENKDCNKKLAELEDSNAIKVMGGKRIPKEDDFAPFETKHYYPGVKEFENYSINLEESKYIDDNVFEKIKRYALKPNDVFVSGAGTIGKVGRMPKTDKTVSLTENAHRIRVFDDSVIDPAYLMFMLSGTNIQNIMKSLTTKTGTPKLSIESLRNIEVPILEIDKQKKLAKKWNDINNKINEIYGQIN